MSIAERLITTPVNQHAVPALRPCSVIVSCVCVSRARRCACMRDLDRISPGEQQRQRKRASHAFKPHSISLQIQNLILNPQPSQLARRAANPRRAFVVGPLVSLPALCSRKKDAFRSLPAPRDRPPGLLKVSSRMPSIRTSPPEAVHDAVAPAVAKLASVGAAPCVEVDAFARAATLRADPANRRLPVRAGRRERAE